MWRHVASNFLTIAIVILLAVGGVVAWGQRQYHVPGPLVEAICLQVKPGSSFGKVAETLVDRGAVSSGYILRVGADYAGQTDKLKAGSFLIAPKASMQEVVGAITGDGQSTCGTEINYRIGVLASDVVIRELDPKTQEFVEVAKFEPSAGVAPAEYAERLADPSVRLRVTLSEGATSWQVVEALKGADFLKGDVTEVPPEGMLSPDSYEVTKDESRTELLAEMQKRQAGVLAEAWATKAEGLPYKTPEEALTMASIVEKETGVPEERARVASVFLNRIAQGMKLQTDPTVIYAVTKGKGALGRGLRQSELRSNSPYNTYVVDGLPPGPIANPGSDAIKAALNPDQTKYLFFVADGSGGHAFAETLAEHNENVKKWRALEASQGDTTGSGAGTDSGN